MDNSFLSSTFTENVNVSVSTPNRDDIKKPSIRASPIPGTTAMFRRSEFSDLNLLSSNSIASSYHPGNFSTRSTRSTRTISVNCLEVAKIRNFGYVNIQSSRILPVVVRNRYERAIMLVVNVAGSDAFKIVNGEEENLSIESGHETRIYVKFTPTKRTTYNRTLQLMVIHDKRSGLISKKYEVCLLGHGGTAILRISQDKNELSPSRFQNNLAVRSTGEYDARMHSSRSASLMLKNNGERVASVYIRALNQHGDDISLNRLSVTPNQFLLNKLCFESKFVNIQVLDEKLWQRMVHGREEIRLAVYSVIERQRLRLIEYGKIRKQQIEPIEDIDFTAFNFGSDESVKLDRSTISSEDVRVFKEELRVNFIRLLPPNVTTQINELHEMADNKFALLPVLFEDDVVVNFDDDEQTTAGRPNKRY